MVRSKIIKISWALNDRRLLRVVMMDDDDSASPRRRVAHAGTCTASDIPKLPAVVTRDGTGANGGEKRGVETPRWFFLDDEDEPRGPYNRAGLKNLFQGNFIHNRTRVWTEGVPDWV